MTAARRGIALLATIVAISLLGVLALAGMRLARARQVGARRLVAGHAATLGAARALDSALATARAWDWALLPVGRRTILLDLAGRERIAVERASETLFRLDAAVARGDALAPARHAASIVVAADLPRLDVGAPLVSAGPVEIERGFAVRASSADPGCARDPASAEVLAADSSAVRWTGRGSGVVAEDAALGAASPFAEVVARLRDAARLTIPAGGRHAPASDSAAVVVALGDLTLGPGHGGGALLVLGRLTIEGPLRFRGSIVALGGAHTRGSGIALTGTLASGGAVHLDGGTLQHDACAARDAAWKAGRLRPLRAWAAQ